MVVQRTNQIEQTEKVWNNPFKTLKRFRCWCEESRWFNELEHFQNYLSHHKIIVYGGLSPDKVIFTGNALSDKTFYLQIMRDPKCDYKFERFCGQEVQIQRVWHIVRQ
jgi:hypothetical protein